MRFPKLLCVAAFVFGGSAGFAELPVPAGVDEKVNALLAKMSLEEKVGQLNQLSTGSVAGPVLNGKTGEDLIRAGLVGALLGTNSSYEVNTYQREALTGGGQHIPLLFGLDVIHGCRTIFPIPLGLSASWNPELIQETAHYAAKEATAQGLRWTFSPMVDIARDPRWGRIAEGAGEDPYLGAAIARAYVRGYQGDRLDAPDSILACAKHFVGYGAAEGGRDYNTTEISERTLRDVYLPPFHAAVDSGVATLMSAFNSLNGVPSSANPFTLTHVLREEWGFQGFVDSDWTAIHELKLHGIAGDDRTAARKGFLAGVDMDMQSTLYLAQLPELVRSGVVPQAKLDDAVRRILRLKFALGLFEHPYANDPGNAVQALPDAGRALARKAAEASFVLLENNPVGSAQLLPITAAPGKRIALIGPLADDAPDMLGCWACEGNPRDVVTLRQALSERCATAGMTLTYAPGTGVGGAADDGIGDALTAAKGADLAIVAVGESSHSSGEASARADLDLPGNQEVLLQAIVATGTPVVAIVFSGRPLTLSWEQKNVPALMMAWAPGIEAGPALVRTLFGDTAPSGRLTVTVPRFVGQVPIYYNALNTGRPQSDALLFGTASQDAYYHTGYIDLPNPPLYPFGYGLTYTSFAYSGLKVSERSVSAQALGDGSAHLTASTEVRNTGSRAGTETVQLYIRLVGTSVARPVKELKGFRRVTLQPGESRQVEFTLGKDELSFYGIDMKRAVEPASLYVWIDRDCTHGIAEKVELK